MTRRSIALLLLALVAPACVQVLGLEEAKVDEGGSSHGAPQAGFVGINTHMNSCFEEPVPACKDCLMGCGTEVSDCVADAECRLKLDSYAYCLEDSCTDNWEECSFDLPPELAACVQSCGDACTGTRLTSECELYCACMSDICPAEPITDCMETCRSLPAEVAICRRAHCGSARNSAAMHDLHCRHASNRQPICLDNDQLNAGERSICLNRAESTWGCNADDDCCSDKCNDGVCD